MAKTSLSSARRGRAHVSRDYTAKLRTDAYVREAGRTEKMSTIGMVGSFAAGAAQLGSAIGTKLKKWEQLKSGAEQLYLEGGEGRDIKDFSFAQALGKDQDYIDKYGGDVSMWDKLLKQAPVTQQLTIGDEARTDKFYGINVAQVGALGESAGLLVDKDSDKNLYDYLKIGGDKGAKTDVSSLLETAKGKRPEPTSPPVVQKIAAQSSNQGSTSVPQLSSKADIDKLPNQLKLNVVKPLTEKFTLPTIAKTDFSAYPEIKSDPIPSISAEDLFQEPPQTRYRSSDIGWDQFDELMSPLRNY